VVQPVSGAGPAVAGMRAAGVARIRGLVFPILRKARKGGESTGFPRVRNSCRSMLTTTTSPRLFMTRPKASSFSGQSPRRTGHGIETWTKVVSGRSASVRKCHCLTAYINQSAGAVVWPGLKRDLVVERKPQLASFFDEQMLRKKPPRGIRG
jgi:hypothetical protein